MHIEKDPKTGGHFVMEGDTRMIYVPPKELGTVREAFAEIEERYNQDRVGTGNYLKMGENGRTATVDIFNDSIFGYSPKISLDSSQTTRKTIDVSKSVSIVAAIDDYTVTSAPEALSKLTEKSMRRIVGNSI
jgi:hypothetical protein